MNLRTTRCVVIALLLSVFAAPVARADGRRVTIEVQDGENGGTRTAGNLLTSLRAVGKHYAVSFESVPSGKTGFDRFAADADDVSPFAHIYVELKAPVSKLFILDPTRDRVVVREVSVPMGTVDELVVETLASIVEASLTTLIEGGSIGRPRQDVFAELGIEPSSGRGEDPSEAAVPPSNVQQRTAMQLGVGYGARLWSSEASLLHGPAVQFLLRLPASKHLELLVGVEGELGFAGTTQVGQYRYGIGSYHARAVMGVHGALGDVVGLRATANLGLGVLAVELENASNLAFEQQTPRTDVHFEAGLAVGVEAAISHHLSIVAQVELLAPIPRGQYYVGEGGARSVVFDPWTIVPSAGLFVAYRWDQ